MPAVVKRLGHNANPAGTAARTASPGLRNQRLPGSLNPAERYAHGMRNGGDRVPGGSTGRRHRAADPERPPRIGATGGASLFTPAYRASHPSAGPYPGDNGPTGAGLADSGGPTRSASGYGWPATEQEPESVWAADDQPDGDYGWTEPGNAPADYDQAADLPGGGYSWATDDLTNAGYSWYRDDLDGLAQCRSGRSATRSAASRRLQENRCRPTRLGPSRPGTAVRRLTIADTCPRRRQ